jgi:hypothetical protein
MEEMPRCAKEWLECDGWRGRKVPKNNTHLGPDLERAVPVTSAKSYATSKEDFGKNPVAARLCRSERCPHTHCCMFAVHFSVQLADPVTLIAEEETAVFGSNNELHTLDRQRHYINRDQSNAQNKTRSIAWRGRSKSHTDARTFLSYRISKTHQIRLIWSQIIFVWK